MRFTLPISTLDKWFGCRHYFYIARRDYMIALFLNSGAIDLAGVRWSLTQDEVFLIQQKSEVD
jgi:hypothetical protein